MTKSIRTYFFIHSRLNKVARVSVSFKRNTNYFTRWDGLTNISDSTASNRINVLATFKFTLNQLTKIKENNNQEFIFFLPNNIQSNFIDNNYKEFIQKTNIPLENTIKINNTLYKGYREFITKEGKIKQINITTEELKLYLEIDKLITNLLDKIQIFSESILYDNKKDSFQLSQWKATFKPYLQQCLNLLPQQIKGQECIAI